MNSYPTYFSEIVNRFLKQEKLQPEDYYNASNQFDLLTTANIVVTLKDNELRKVFCTALYNSYKFYSLSKRLPKDSQNSDEWYKNLTDMVEILTTTSFTSSSTATPTREVAVVDKDEYDFTKAQAGRVSEMEKKIEEQNRQIEILTQNEKIKEELAETLYLATQKQAKEEYSSNYKKLCRAIMDIEGMYDLLTGSGKLANGEYEEHAMLNIIGLIRDKQVLNYISSNQLSTEICGTIKMSKYVNFGKHKERQKITNYQVTCIENLIEKYKRDELFE